MVNTMTKEEALKLVQEEGHDKFVINLVKQTKN